MPVLTADQVVQLADQVGVPRSQLATCVAIAYAESGLNTNATGYNRDPETHQLLSRDRGLWQINDYWHPDVSDACAYDATCNARAMYRISNGGTNWNPWSTFGSGSYRSFLTAAQLAINYYFAHVVPGGAVPPPQDGSYRATLLQYIFTKQVPFYNRSDIIAAEREGRWDDIGGQFIGEVTPDFWHRADITGAWAAGRHNDVFGEYIKEGYLNPQAPVVPGTPPLPPSPADNSGQITNDINAGHGPISTTARMLQRLADETADLKYGPGHRPGPIMGGIVQ